ncbi:hypothetical protein D2E26_1131 [Bifidobacterium dolichotidis]|uniref:Uncharacterized protein n=1 Tax=Bifidobacterium dolichotidis TaxID=2306976 RepID=A0A430FQH0_9BIFI|nr:hypothetical protein D2E26_1131 [Bifidobacterium dolichotidis]
MPDCAVFKAEGNKKYQALCEFEWVSEPRHTATAKFSKSVWSGLNKSAELSHS